MKWSVPNSHMSDALNLERYLYIFVTKFLSMVYDIVYVDQW